MSCGYDASPFLMLFGTLWSAVRCSQAQAQVDGVVGLLAGLIARFLLPGPNNPPGFLVTMVLGIAGAFVATFIGQSIGWYRIDQGAGLVGATLGSIIVLFIWHRLVVQRAVNDPGVTRANWPPPRA